MKLTKRDFAVAGVTAVVAATLTSGCFNLNQSSIKSSAMKSDAFRLDNPVQISIQFTSDSVEERVLTRNKLIEVLKASSIISSSLDYGFIKISGNLDGHTPYSVEFNLLWLDQWSGANNCAGVRFISWVGYPYCGPTSAQNARTQACEKLLIELRSMAQVGGSLSGRITVSGP